MASEINNTKKTAFYLLLLITLAGLFFRLWRLSHHSAWTDEFFTLFVAQQSILDNIRASFFYNVHPPLYTLMMHFVIYMGKSEFILRLPSVIFGVITIPLSYLLAKELFNRKVGLITALILALSPLHIWMSQEARPYTLLPLLIIVCIYFFIKYLRTCEPRFLAYYIISIIVSLLTHYFTLFIVLTTNVFIFLYFKKYKHILRNWVVYQIPIFVLMVILIPFTFSSYGSTVWAVYDLSWFTATVPGIFNTFNIGRFNPFINFGAPLVLNNPLGIFSSIPLMIVWFLITCLFVYLFIKGLYATKDNVKRHFLLCFVFIPILVPYLAHIYLSFDFGANRIIFAGIIYYMIIAKGVTSSKNLAIFFVLFIVVTSGISLYHYYYKFEEENWRGMGKYLSDNAKKGDLIIALTSFNTDTGVDYYYNGEADIIGTLDIKAIFKKGYSQSDPKITEDNVDEMLRLTDGYERVWVVENRARDSGIVLLNHLNESSDQFQFLKSEHFTDGFINVYLYKINSP